MSFVTRPSRTAVVARNRRSAGVGRDCRRCAAGAVPRRRGGEAPLGGVNVDRGRQVDVRATCIAPGFRSRAVRVTGPCIGARLRAARARPVLAYRTSRARRGAVGVGASIVLRGCFVARAVLARAVLSGTPADMGARRPSLRTRPSRNRGPRPQHTHSGPRPPRRRCKSRHACSVRSVREPPPPAHEGVAVAILLTLTVHLRSRRGILQRVEVTAPSNKTAVNHAALGGKGSILDARWGRKAVSIRDLDMLLPWRLSSLGDISGPFEVA